MFEVVDSYVLYHLRYHVCSVYVHTTGFLNIGIQASPTVLFRLKHRRSQGRRSKKTTEKFGLLWVGAYTFKLISMVNRP